ncbi:unnamed protein product [Porites evermanni]|uniref:Serine aminopeptidase S33 domain-containing protein n=1 Tax=Porites evermanni TaxID=104178 RepID=A0ABN8RZQ7_9CNID|nr:unnamed protein product [Porites evermanni]
MELRNKSVQSNLYCFKVAVPGNLLQGSRRKRQPPGGTIAVLSVMERPYFFAGAIFSAPSIKVDANPCTVCLGRIVSWIMPSYQIRPPIDPSLLSQDPTQVEKYANDSLNWHEGMKVRWVGAILDAMNESRGTCQSLQHLIYLSMVMEIN